MLTAAPPLFFSTQSPTFFFIHFDFLCRPILTEDFTFVPHSHGSGRPAILDSRPLPCPPPPPRSPPTASAASVAFHRIFPPPAPPRLLLHFQNSDSPSGSVGHLKNSQLPPPPPPLTGTFLPLLRLPLQDLPDRPLPAATIGCHHSRSLHRLALHRCPVSEQ
ncbi:hypothetical protein ACP275_10G158500 [Erythranthe tilingii]